MTVHPLFPGDKDEGAEVPAGDVLIEKAGPEPTGLDDDGGEYRDILPAWMTDIEEMRSAIRLRAARHGHSAAYHGLRFPGYVLKVAVYALRGIGVLTGRLFRWWHWTDGWAARIARRRRGPAGSRRRDARPLGGQEDPRQRGTDRRRASSARSCRRWRLSPCCWPAALGVAGARQRAGAGPGVARQARRAGRSSSPRSSRRATPRRPRRSSPGPSASLRHPGDQRGHQRRPGPRRSSPTSTATARAGAATSTCRYGVTARDDPAAPRAVRLRPAPPAVRRVARGRPPRARGPPAAVDRLQRPVEGQAEALAAAEGREGRHLRGRSRSAPTRAAGHVTVPLFEVNWLVGAAPGQGKTGAVRVLDCAAALDPICDLWIHELAGKGDLEPLAQVCHRYCSGLDDEADRVRRRVVAACCARNWTGGPTS